MQRFNMYEAKTNFSKIINLVEHNEEVLIARNGVLVAKVIPFSEHTSGIRQFGRLKNKVTIHENFDEPLPEDMIQSFYETPL